MEALLSKQAVEAMRKWLEQSAKEWEEKKKEAEECYVEYEKEKEKKQLRLCKICGERPAATGGGAMMR